MVRILAIAAAVALAAATPAIADAAAGQKAFQAQCAICHAAVAGGRKIGPSLYGVVGRTSGTLPGFNYSAAMKAAAIVWSGTELATYLEAPTKRVPGTKMAYLGLRDPQKRADVVSYLETLK